MQSVVAFLLLCFLVTRGTAEGHPSPHLLVKRAAKSSGDYHLSSQNAASAYSNSRPASPLQRLTVMDFSVPELSATDGSDAAIPPTPTKTPEPNADFEAPVDFSGPVRDDSSAGVTRSTGSEGEGRPRIHFRRFNSDGSLAAMFATPTESPRAQSDPMGDFFDSITESSPSNTPEPETDSVPEATEASDDVESMISSTQGNETSVSSALEFSPVATPSQEVFEEGEGLPGEIEGATKNSDENAFESRPRQSVFVSGPTTASVTFTAGQPPQFSFSTNNDEKPIEEKNDEPVQEKDDEPVQNTSDEPVKEENDTPLQENSEELVNEKNDDDANASEEIVPTTETEATDDDLIEASSEPELDIENGGDVAIGRLQPKSPGRPTPSNSVNVAAVSELPKADILATDSPSPISAVPSEDSKAQENPQPFDVNSPQSISFSPKPLDLDDTKNPFNISEDIAEMFGDPSPVAVSSSVSDASGNFEDPVGSTEPSFSPEPEASAEVAIATGEPELLSVALIVRHPPSFEAQELAEEIRLNSNEFITPDEWEIVTLFRLSELSKFANANLSDADGQENGSEDDIISFEVLMETQCTAGAGCETMLEKHKQFIRDGRMDETLAAHDFSRVSVFLEGEMTERSEPLAAIGTSGLGVGVIAGIAVGAIAVISLVVLVAVVAANMRNASSTNGSSDYDSELEFEDDVGPDHEFPLDQGSFMISNFGGTPRHSTAMIPWLNNSSTGSGVDINSRSFISVDSMTPGDVNRMSQYRFDETKSSVSGSDTGEEISRVADPDESGSTVYAVQ